MEAMNGPRFRSHCQERDGHFIYVGGRQFNLTMGFKSYRRTSATQAAYVIQYDIERIPPGMGVARTCKVKGCVRHVALFLTRELTKLSSQRRLTDEDVAFIRSIPNLKYLAPSDRRVIIDDILERLGERRVSREYLMGIRSHQRR